MPPLVHVSKVIHYVAASLIVILSKM